MTYTPLYSQSNNMRDEGVVIFSTTTIHFTFAVSRHNKTRVKIYNFPLFTKWTDKNCVNH